MKYKVRIVKSPTSKMAYGGQSNYGLDLGQRGVYDTMNENPFEPVSETLQEVPEELANIEAEKGETAIGDFNQDGSLEHMNIGGKKHSQGGTKLAVPDNTFIMSDTKKLAIGGAVLAEFGKSATTKQKFTPAQLAKAYPLNKWQAILDDPDADPVYTKPTAEMMRDKNLQKLAKLARLQEAMKGFPQGDPQFASMVLGPLATAEYGGMFLQDDDGMAAYQNGGITPRTVSRAEYDSLIKAGFTPIGNNIAERKTKVKVKDAEPAKDPVYATTTNTAPGRGSASFNKAFGDARKAGLKEFTWNGKRYGTEMYQPGPSKQVVITPGRDAVPEQFKEDIEQITFTPGTTIPGSDPFVPVDTKGYKGPNPGNLEMPEIQEVDAGAMPFLGTSLLVGPQRESFFAAPMTAALPQPTFYDPNRDLAANAEMANMNKQYIAGFGSPQAYMANTSAADAKALENAAGINSRFQNLNVGVANQFNPIQTDIMNKLMAYQADRADKLFWNNQQGKKDFRNQTREWFKNLDAYRGNVYDTATKTNLTNAINPYYTFINTPKGGKIQWRPGMNVYKMITGQMPGQSASNVTYDQYLAAIEKLKETYPNASPAQLDRAVMMQYPALRNSVPGIKDDK